MEPEREAWGGFRRKVARFLPLHDVEAVLEDVFVEVAEHEHAVIAARLEGGVDKKRAVER